MNYITHPIDNSLAIKEAEEFFKDWTFENITLDLNGDPMESKNNDEKNVFLYAGTNVNGSTCSCDMGCTFKEWRAMDTDTQDDIIKEFMANVVDVYVSGENGESVD